MFSKSLELTLNDAFARAREKRHEFITVEHLLLGLLDNPEASQVLSACGANLERLRAGLGIFIDETTPHVPLKAAREIQPTISFQRVLQRAIYQAQSTGNPEVNGVNVLLAIFGEQESQAVYFLNQENISRHDVIQYTAHGVTKPAQPLGESDAINEESESNNLGSSAGRKNSVDRERIKEGSNEENLIELYATNLNERARSGKIDPLIGRREEIMRGIQVLCRRRKNNPLFVGEAGVGKTAIAEGLAQMIVDKKVPQALANCTIYSLDLGVLLAGTKYRGDFEKRFKSVLKALSRQNGAIVFIDEIHNLIGAGSATGGTMDASNLIKPLLSSGELRCMGATTYDEFRNYFAKDSALMRRFQKIDINEPSKDETLKILHGLKSKFESYHGVKYTEDALERAVELSERYINDRQLPDKAIDVIDEAGAYQKIQNDKGAKKQMVDRHDIEKVIAKIARIPIAQLTSSDQQLLKNLAKKLKTQVYGQDQAIEMLVNAIKLSRSGLKDPNKPIGSFLLAGPTGVGKTEVTKQLAHELGVELMRFDMSEYMERHAVSRLIGAPPGYVGYDQGGLLTEEIIKHPYAVVLLDEIEKAHPELFNILLQVMDYGFLTDNNGRKADFRHAIIIMTTNAGAEDLERNTIGFSDQKNVDDNLGAIKGLFSPEFRNRLDAIVHFHHLDQAIVSRVVDKYIRELNEQLSEQHAHLEMTPQAKAWLVEHGYDRKMGARPMARLIQEKIKQPIAEEILFGKLGSNEKTQVEVDVVNDELVVSSHKLERVS